jgi:hypothetical protein
MMARIFLTAIVAGFLAIMIAGPGIMIPGHFELWAPVVCGQFGDDYEPVVQTREVGAHHDATGKLQGGTSYRFLCANDDDDTEDVTGRLVGTAFGGYFIGLFMLFFLIGLLKGKAKPPAQQIPGGPPGPG